MKTFILAIVLLAACGSDEAPIEEADYEAVYTQHCELILECTYTLRTLEMCEQDMRDIAMILQPEVESNRVEDIVACFEAEPCADWVACISQIRPRND